MSSNTIRQVPLLTLLVVAVLVAFSSLPDSFWTNLNLKPVHLFSSIQKDSVSIRSSIAHKPEEVKSPKKPEILVKQELACPPGQVCIEDFDAKGEGMKKFIRALLQDAPKEPVRIAFFGDSFIEGDMLCGDFRDTLQATFGGRGVGYVPITSPVANFRSTIRHEFQNFRTFSVLKQESNQPAPGVSGFSFVPQGNNSVRFSTHEPDGASRFDRVRLFYRSNQNFQLTYDFDQKHSLSLNGWGKLSEYSLSTASNHISFSFKDDVTLYGMSFEADRGVYVDNFSIRGNSGWGLLGVSEDMYRQFNDFQHYKLVILQYGLNVVESNTTDLTWYKPKMKAAIERIKKGFPEASILLIGVSDRSTKQDGAYKTFPSIPILVKTQQELAQKTGVTFWNLWEAMGGYGSMVRFVDAGLANKDYTHLKYAGGRKIARLLAQALLFEKKKYEKNRMAEPAVVPVVPRRSTTRRIRIPGIKRDSTVRKAEPLF